MKEIKIGNVSLDNPYILAPMAGVSDLPFRLLASEMGAGMVCMEMVSAKAITYGNKKTEDMLRIDESEAPVSLQIFGSEPKVMADAVRRISHIPYKVLDINMGCPVPKIVGNGEGSALMKNPKLIGEIVREVVRASDRPVTIKIRKGFDENNINAVEVAKIAESEGVSAIAVHGRTREQYYSGKADWDIIRQVKETVSIPVIANGDVFDVGSAVKIQEETGADMVMVARGARGNPWIFRELKEYYENGIVIPKPAKEEIKEMMLHHARLLIEHKGEFVGIREMRQHASWYTKGMEGGNKLRDRINHANSYGELEEIIRGI